MKITDMFNNDNLYLFRLQKLREGHNKVLRSDLFALLMTGIFIALILSPLNNIVRAIDQQFEVNHRLYVDIMGIWVMGEVINRKTVSVKNVYVRITFFLNDSVKNFTAPVGLEVIAPNRRGPFTKNVETQEVEGYTGYTVEVERWEQSDSKPGGLKILGGSIIFSSNNTLIQITIKNNSTEIIDAFIVIIFLYDEKGFLATAGQDLYFQDGLLPGDITQCEVSTKFANETSGVSKFVVTAESVNYAVLEEVIRFIVLNPEPFDYRILIIIPISAVIAIIAITIIGVRKQKRRTSKRSA